MSEYFKYDAYFSTINNYLNFNPFYLQYTSTWKIHECLMLIININSLAIKIIAIRGHKFSSQCCEHLMTTGTINT